jgi:hypothetical protein
MEYISSHQDVGLFVVFLVGIAFPCVCNDIAARLNRRLIYVTPCLPVRGKKNICHTVNDCRVDHVSISKSVYNELPHEARRRFEAYWENARVRDGVLTFELSVYRWKDIEPWVPDVFLAGSQACNLLNR